MSTSARQNVYAACERVKFSGLVSGVAKKVFSKLPNGNIPLRGYVAVVEPFNSGTSDSITVGKALSGTAASANAYLTSQSIAAAAGTRYALTGLPALIDDSAGGIEMTITWTGAGDPPDEGEIVVVLEQIADGRDHYNES